MHPDYIKYKELFRSSSTTMANFRVPDKLKETLDAIAQMEDDTLSGILLEGAARVVESRLQGDGIDNIRQTIEERRRKEDQILDSLTSVSEELFGPKPE